MSILRGLAAHETRSMPGAQGQLADLLRLRGEAPRSVSLSISPEMAMKHPTVNGCVSLISNIATWPTHAYRKADGVNRQEEKDPPIVAAPSMDATPIEWRREVLTSWLKRGTAFGLVAKQAGGWPTQIELVQAERISVRSTHNGPLKSWVWSLDGEEIGKWPNGPLWVAKGLWTIPGVPVGISPIEMAMGSIGLGLAAEQFGASWFYDGAIPSAVLYSDQQIDQTQAKTIKERFVAAIRGKREPAVLGAGMRYEQVSVAANESQFLETLDKNREVVEQFFLPQLGSDASVTYANVEARGLHLLQQGLSPWLAKFEETMNALTPRPLYVKANADSLLRLDSKTRAEIGQIYVRNGKWSRDDWRRKDDEPPLPDGSGGEYLWPPYRSTVLPEDMNGASA